MQVIEDDDERPLIGQHFEVPARGPLRLLLDAADTLGADRGRNPVGHELVMSDGGNRVTVATGGSADDLGQRPVGDSLTVCGAPPDHDARLPSDPLNELPGKARLADPGRAEQRDTLRCV